MKQIGLYFALFLIGSQFSCSSKKDVVMTPPQGEALYTLQKGACFGRCPRYTLEIFPNGNAVFTGKAHTDKIGTYEKTLTPSEMNTLLEVFSLIEFHALPDTFPSMIPDLPGVWISHHDGKSRKTVYGKEDRPEKLLNIQSKLEAIATSTSGWELLVDAPQPKERASAIIKDRLIIQTHPNGMSDAWLKSYSRYNLTLMNKISDDLEYYVLRYNTESISPNDMISLLKKDPVVRLVEFDKTTNMRKRGSK